MDAEKIKDDVEDMAYIFKAALADLHQLPDETRQHYFSLMKVAEESFEGLSDVVPLEGSHDANLQRIERLYSVAADIVVLSGNLVANANSVPEIAYGRELGDPLSSLNIAIEPSADSFRE